MIRSLSIPIAAAMFLAAAALPVSAQEPCELDMRLAAFGGLELDDSLRVATVAGPLLEGRLVGSVCDSLYIVSIGEERFVRLGTIDALWVQGTALRGGMKSGALVGGVAGLVVGVLFEWLSDELCDTGDCGHTTGETISIISFWTAVGTATGALTGAGIGSMVPEWHLRYEAPRYAPAGGNR